VDANPVAGARTDDVCVAATLAAVIAGVAIGSGIGSCSFRSRANKAAGMLAFTLSLAAVTASWTYRGGIANPDDGGTVRRRLRRLRISCCWAACCSHGADSSDLGTVSARPFPFALALVDDRLHPAPGRFGLVYAINTLGSGRGRWPRVFLFIPAFGIQRRCGLSADA
jgi:hypothetical protein